jgi:hypothetical protein
MDSSKRWIYEHPRTGVFVREQSEMDEMQKSVEELIDRRFKSVRKIGPQFVLQTNAAIEAYLANRDPQLSVIFDLILKDTGGALSFTPRRVAGTSVRVQRKIEGRWVDVNPDNNQPLDVDPQHETE